MVVDGGERPVLVSSAAGRVEALDVETGEMLWSLEELEKNHVPSVLVEDGLVVAPSSQPGQTAAFRLNGDPGTAPELAWRAEGVASGFASPVSQGPCVLMTNKSGVLHCLDREDGHLRWRHRMSESCWATPVVSGDRVYFFHKDGRTTVIEAGADGPEVLAENAVGTGDATVYGVAATRDAFLLRTGTEVVRIGPDQIADQETEPAPQDDEASR